MEAVMTRRPVDPLREVSVEEREELERLARATAEPAGLVARAKALLAVAGGGSYTAACSWLWPRNQGNARSRSRAQRAASKRTRLVAPTLRPSSLEAPRW